MRTSFNPDFWSKITDCNQNYSVHTPPPPYIIAYFSAGVVLMRPSWGLPTFLVTAVFQAFSCVTVLPTPQPRQVETFAPDFDYFRHKGVNDVFTIPFMVSNVKGETIWCQLTFSPPASRWFSSSYPDRFGDPSCGRWWGMGGGIPSGQRASTSEGKTDAFDDFRATRLKLTEWCLPWSPQSSVLSFTMAINCHLPSPWLVSTLPSVTIYSSQDCSSGSLAAVLDHIYGRELEWSRLTPTEQDQACVWGNWNLINLQWSHHFYVYSIFCCHVRL